MRGSRYDREEELDVNEGKEEEEDDDPLPVQNKLHYQRLHAREALHLAAGQHIIGQVIQMISSFDLGLLYIRDSYCATMLLCICFRCRLLLSCQCPSGSSSEATVWGSKNWTAALG